MGKKKVSVICPVFNEAQNIAPFFARMKKVLEKLEKDLYTWEIIFTNNCSTDETLEEILKIRKDHVNVKVYTFSRNFGYQCSIFAGLENASGDLFMIIDVDCEDPPEMLFSFLKTHAEGFDIVYGLRAERDESRIMHETRKIFYRVNRLLADYEVILDMAEFFLITKVVRDALICNKSNYPFLRAEIGYVGFRKKGIPYRREARKKGKSHYNLWGNFNFALAGILSSTTLWLRMSAFVGLPLLLVNALAGGLGIVRMSLGQESWGNEYGILVLVDFCFVIYTGLFTALYIARIYKNGLRRPLYFIDPSKSAY